MSWTIFCLVYWTKLNSPPIVTVDNGSGAPQVISQSPSATCSLTVTVVSYPTLDPWYGNYQYQKRSTFLSGYAIITKNLEADSLGKKGVKGPESCPICCRDGETLDHILLNCSYSKTPWDLLLYNMQLPQPPSNSGDLWSKWTIATGPKKEATGPLSLASIACWCLWKERNQRGSSTLRQRRQRKSLVAPSSPSGHPVTILKACKLFPLD